MNAEIIAVGTELLLGDILNTNARFLARELSAIGINVFFQSVVGDNPERLHDTLKTALSRSEIVITTGGLGPTCDDLTKETGAEVLGLELVEDEETLQKIKTYFKELNRPLTDNNLKQALFPKGAYIFRNNNGTAPGFVCTNGEKRLIMLPGPPREMEPMYLEHVKPYLLKLTDKVIVSSQIRIFGMGESAVEDKLRDLMQGGNPSLAPYAKSGEVELRVTAKADNEEEAKGMIKPVIEQVKERIGKYIYGIDVSSLEEQAVKVLKEKGLKIAAAESCTGGYFGKRITNVSGSSDIFECGVICYSNRIKHEILGVCDETLNEYGAVSKQCAFELCQGIIKLSGADVGVAITGIAGPTGGTEEKPVGTVYVAVGDRHTVLVKRLELGSKMRDREYIRYLATSNALNMCLKFIENIK